MTNFYGSMFLTEKEAVDLLSGKFGEQLLKGMLGYVTTISWGLEDQLASKYNLLSHGTAFLANFGEKTFLVTAAHVLEGFRQAKSDNPQVKSYVGEVEYDLEARLISCLGSSTLDIATFDINLSEICKLGKAITFGAKNWPPEEVEVGQGIIFAGFPGQERIDKGGSEYEFGLYVALTPVDSVSERHFGCKFNRNSWIDSFGKGFPKEGYDLGGVSGGPAFVLNKSDAGLFSWDLVGVVYTAMRFDAEILLVHHAKFISADGLIQQPFI
jgi:hypothetical protein